MANRKIDGLKVTAGLSAAVADLRELEDAVPEDFRAAVRNHRYGVEMMHRDVLSLVHEVNARCKARKAKT